MLAAHCGMLQAWGLEGWGLGLADLWALRATGPGEKINPLERRHISGTN